MMKVAPMFSTVRLLWISTPPMTFSPELNLMRAVVDDAVKSSKRPCWPVEWSITPFFIRRLGFRPVDEGKTIVRGTN